MNCEVVNFDGGVLQRGFWLYVWEVKPPRRRAVYYVGRTGDSSSKFAQSPFVRMGQHLGFFRNSNMLWTHLKGRTVDPEKCKYRLVAHGPVLKEARSLKEHRKRRDVMAALEKALAEEMESVGYDVMNEVHCRKELDGRIFARVRKAFGAEFPKLVNGRRQ